jgi:hypothetical protein
LRNSSVGRRGRGRSGGIGKRGLCRLPGLILILQLCLQCLNLLLLCGESVFQRLNVGGGDCRRGRRRGRSVCRRRVGNRFGLCPNSDREHRHQDCEKQGLIPFHGSTVLSFKFVLATVTSMVEFNRKPSITAAVLTFCFSQVPLLLPWPSASRNIRQVQ